MASADPVFAAKAAVKLGFVLSMISMTRSAPDKRSRSRWSGNEEQAGLAAMNLAAMDQLSAERAQGHGHDERDDGVNVATDRDAPLKFRRWFKRT